MFTTGYIPFSSGATLRMKHITFNDPDSSTYTGIASYNSEREFIGVTNYKNLTRGYDVIRDEDGTVTVDTGACINSDYSMSSTLAYIRIMSPSIEVGSIVTVDEEIKNSTETSYSWQNTGRMYQCADYEPRLTAVEERLTEIECNSGSVPDYVAAEAERVADAIAEDMTHDSFTIVLSGDMHVPYNEETAEAVVHTALAIGEISNAVPIDLCAYLGDYVSGGTSSTLDESQAAYKFIRRAFNGSAHRSREVWLRGNHDNNPYCFDGTLSPSRLYSLIDSSNRDAKTTSDGRCDGYGYMDFDEKQMRVIYLNTSDCGDVAYEKNDGSYNVPGVGAAQLRWLAYHALDLGEKKDASSWGIIILSHVPLNWNDSSLTDANGIHRTMNVKNALSILDAYNRGSAGTVVTNGESVSYDFTDSARGEITALFHGHTHNFRISEIGTSGFVSISIPQVCAGRYNEYTAKEDFGEFNSDGEAVYYRKTPHSASNTSFCAAVIDRIDRRIILRNYGAGYDRTVTY